MSRIDLDALEKLADEATPGPWKAVGTIYEHMNCEVRGGKKGEGQAIAQVWDGPHAFKDGQWIAAANPDAIKAVVAALREAMALLKPFSEAAAYFDAEQEVLGGGMAPYSDRTMAGVAGLNAGNLRAARAFLVRNGKGEG